MELTFPQGGPMTWISRFGQDLNGPRKQKEEKEYDEQGLNEKCIGGEGEQIF